MGGKISHAAQCAKSRAFITVLKAIFDIDSIEQQCVIIKGLLHSKQLWTDMVSIWVDQSLSNSASYEHICLENIKILYKP